ncbi:MAG: hypothetical protein K8R53_06920 [Bacteroidales bacterium]|nr:hypothetical protein [Bacteroidales bacterium]
MKRGKFQLIAFLFVAFTLVFTACNKDEDDPATPTGKDTDYSESEVKDGQGNLVEIQAVVKDYGKGTGTVTWSGTKTYILNGLVFVNDGQTLTIEAGTVIKGKPGTGENASAFIVARGGKIDAQGTAIKPIIFCAETDDTKYDHTVGALVQGDNIPATTRGLWGGVIVLGKAGLNSTPGETAIEGIPTTESRGLYGGTEDTDNSGTFEYISIRNGGTDIGEGNEINGLTLGGVGSGTVIDYVEVVGNKDDGVEFFGGVPQLKHILVAYAGDDSYDYDEGFRGKGQFWCAIQDPNEGDRIGEHDGGTEPETAQPYAIPDIFNATYIGRGVDQGSRLITFRDNAGGHYANSIFVSQEKGIDIEMTADAENTYNRFKSGELTIKNNIFWNVADGTGEGIFKVSFKEGSNANPDSANAVQTFNAKFAEWLNTGDVDPGVSIENPVPAGTVTGDLATVPDTWFESVNFKGAFDPNVNWAEGWTRTFPGGTK